MNGKASSLHSPEPGHLAFGKLMDGYFQLAEHFVVGQLADDVKCQVFVFQSIVDKVVRMNALGYQPTYFVYHPFVQSLAQATGDFLTPKLPVYVYTDDEAVQLWKRTLVYRSMSIIFFDFNSADGAFHRIYIRCIVQAFIGCQYLCQLIQ